MPTQRTMRVASGGAQPFQDELVVGLVGPMGTDSGEVVATLTAALAEVGFATVEVRLTGLLRRVVRHSGLSFIKDRFRDEFDRYTYLIKKGDQFCKRTRCPDALARLALAEINWRRRKINVLPNRQASPRAPRMNRGVVFVIRSLKRKKEVELLRTTYGDSFSLLALCSPRERRIESLAKKIAASRQEFDPNTCKADANLLIQRDQHEDIEDPQIGQDVQGIFSQADFFVDATSREATQRSLHRFVSLTFSDPFCTPTQDEFGMAIATVASLRSADLSRQVGAAILTNAGSLICTGMNDVARPGGGQFWSGDDGDCRDFQLGKNRAAEIKRLVLEDVVVRLGKAGVLTREHAAAVSKEASKAIGALFEKADLRDARVMDLLEFGRTVHAEAAAIADAAIRGIALKGCTLFTTTFPCHECTRHIVAAGIERVVYISPYPKSMASVLFHEIVDVDAANSGNLSDGDVDANTRRRVRFEQYVGLSPERFGDFFVMLQRKFEGPRGESTVVQWDKQSADLRFSEDARRYRVAEAETALNFEQLLNGIGFTYSFSGDFGGQDGQAQKH